jgi:DNA-binding CsgD family transcriptional regulator
MLHRHSLDVAAASYRLQTLSAVTRDVLPTLAAITGASFAFVHHGPTCGGSRVFTWPTSDVVDRYIADYVPDCPFEPIKQRMTDSVLPITRFLTRRELSRTAFYTDLLRPNDLEHHVELRFDAATDEDPGTGIILCRGKRAGEFEDDDIATLTTLRPALLAAFHRASLLDTALDRAHALEAILALGGQGAIRLAVDADGNEVHLHPPATQIEPTALAILRTANHPLRILARDVARGRAMPAEAGVTLKLFTTADGTLYDADVALATASEGRPLAIVSLTPRKPDTGWKLSPAETLVLREIVAGRSNEEIGKRLFISPETVRTHCTRIYRKMGVRSRLEAAALARAHGL